MNSTFVTGVTTSLQVSDNSLMMLGSQAGWTTGTSKTDWLAKRHTSKKSCVIPLLAQQASFPIVYYHPLAFLQKRAATNKKVFDVSYDGSVAFVIVLLWQSYFRLFPFRLWYMGGGRGEDMREVSDAIKVPLERPRKPSKHAINFLKWPHNCQQNGQLTERMFKDVRLYFAGLIILNANAVDSSCL